MQQCHGEHCHWVSFLGQGEDETSVAFGQITPLLPLVGKFLALGIGGVPAGQQQKEHGLRKWFLAFGRFLGLRAEFWNRVASESDALHGIKLTAIVEHDGKPPHAQHCIIYLNLADNLLPIFLPQLGQLYNGHKKYSISFVG